MSRIEHTNGDEGLLFKLLEIPLTLENGTPVTVVVVIPLAAYFGAALGRTKKKKWKLKLLVSKVGTP